MFKTVIFVTVLFLAAILTLEVATFALDHIFGLSDSQEEFMTICQANPPAALGNCTIDTLEDDDMFGGHYLKCNDLRYFRVGIKKSNDSYDTCVYTPMYSGAYFMQWKKKR